MRMRLAIIIISACTLFISCRQTYSYYQLRSDVPGYRNVDRTKNAGVVDSGEIVQYIGGLRYCYIRTVDKGFYQYIETHREPDSLLQNNPINHFFSEKYFLKEEDSMNFRKKHKKVGVHKRYLSPYDR